MWPTEVPDETDPVMPAAVIEQKVPIVPYHALDVAEEYALDAVT